MRKSILVISFMTFILVGMVGCGKADVADNPNQESIIQSEQEIETQSKQEFYETEEETFAIDTPYGNLYYSTKWENAVNIETTQESPYVTSFVAVLEEREIRLFDIVCGTSEEGYLLGEITTKEDTMTIYLVDYSSDFPDDLSEEANATLMAMIEDVNVVISKLVYVSGMEIAE